MSNKNKSVQVNAPRVVSTTPRHPNSAELAKPTFQGWDAFAALIERLRPLVGDNQDDIEELNHLAKVCVDGRAACSVLIDQNDIMYASIQSLNEKIGGFLNRLERLEGRESDPVAERRRIEREQVRERAAYLSGHYSVSVGRGRR